MAGDTLSPDVPRTDGPQILWRMQGPSRVVSAALFTRTAGTELRVFFEPEEAGDLLSSQLEERPQRVKQLERRATRLKNALRDQGWVVLGLPSSNGGQPAGSAEPAGLGRLFKAGAIGLGLVAVAGLGWYRSSRKKDRAGMPGVRAAGDTAPKPPIES